MRSPLRWPGGKSRLARSIVELLPEHEAYVETCCGGASVFWAKPRSRAEVLNDADGELVNFYYVLRKRARRLASEVDSMPYSRGLFGSMLAERPKTAFRRAVRFWYLNRVAFGAKRRGASFGVKASGPALVLPGDLLADPGRLAERLRGVAFESVDVVRLIQLYDRSDTLFYLDPPYWGLSQAYACRFSDEDHVRLSAALRRVRGDWFLSYNDCPTVRRTYAGFPVRRFSTRYTIGCNSASGGSDAAEELLISNRPIRRRVDA